MPDINVKVVLINLIKYPNFHVIKELCQRSYILVLFPILMEKLLNLMMELQFIRIIVVILISLNQKINAQEKTILKSVNFNWILKMAARETNNVNLTWVIMS